MGRKVAWDAEITEEHPNEFIAWQSLPGSSISNRGEVRFSDAPGNRGTQVYVRLTYQPLLGTAGAALARLMTEEPSQQINNDLSRLKAILETGDSPTVKNQPHGKLVIGPERQHANGATPEKEARR